MIKLCPNCEAKLTPRDMTRTPCQVRCPMCGMSGPVGSNKTVAKRKWNDVPRGKWREIAGLPSPLPDGLLIVFKGDSTVYTTEFGNLYDWIDQCSVPETTHFLILPKEPDDEVPDDDSIDSVYPVDK